jgi:hypothetical protein
LESGSSRRFRIRNKGRRKKTQNSLFSIVAVVAVLGCGRWHRLWKLFSWTAVHRPLRRLYESRLITSSSALIIWKRSCLAKIPMGSSNAYSKAAEHVQCLDMLWVESPPAAVKPFQDCAILLEVWVLGGLLLMNMAIPEDTVVSIRSKGTGISARVVSCEQDDYGFLVQLAVAEPGWFPEGYTPPYVLSPQQ